MFQSGQPRIWGKLLSLSRPLLFSVSSGFRAKGLAAGFCGCGILQLPNAVGFEPVAWAARNRLSGGALRVMFLSFLTMDVESFPLLPITHMLETAWRLTAPG